ncbi:MAG: hypothetical protein CL912_09430 [Deltaproteobacteria bacterium]|nr:hypothetical protein [Deltaproteobacteria bacterium]
MPIQEFVPVTREVDPVSRIHTSAATDRDRTAVLGLTTTTIMVNIDVVVATFQRPLPNHKYDSAGYRLLSTDTYSV